MVRRIRRKKKINNLRSNLKDDDLLLRTDDVATIFRCSRRYVYTLREEGMGPRWIIVRGIVRYKQGDVIAWMRNVRKARIKVVWGSKRILGPLENVKARRRNAKDAMDASDA